MELFDRTFWRMTVAFLCIILFGIGSVAVINTFAPPVPKNHAGFQGGM